MKSQSVLLCLLVLAASCTKKTEDKQPEAASATPPAAAKLYFEHEGALFVANLDGSNSQKLFTGYDPAPFPSGTKIAYTHYSEKSYRLIAVTDPPSNFHKTFTSIEGDNNYGPVVSPDGKLIAFNHFAGHDWAIAVVDTSGATVHMLTQPVGNYSPTWNRTSDGVFYQDMKGLYSVSLDGNNTKKLLNLDTLYKMRASASSAMRITTSDNDRTFFFDVDGETDIPFDYPWATIYKFDSQSGTLYKISPDSVFAAAPFASADGKTIYFEGFEAKDIPTNSTEEEPLIEHYIYAMASDGSGVHRICKGSRPTVR